MFMNKTDKLNRVVDDAMDQVVAALENIKVHAISTANEIGRTTRKSTHRAQWAKGEAWSDATSRAKVLRSRVQLYLQEQPLHTIVLALAAGFLLTLVLLFFRMNRKESPTLKKAAPLR